MASKLDVERKAEKVRKIVTRLIEIRDSEHLLLSMLDETKLDLMILALGLGEVITERADQ